MGQYFDIVLRNAKTGEEKTVEVWTARNGRGAWEFATARALTEIEAVWSPEGDAKYWFLASITDTTAR